MYYQVKSTQYNSTLQNITRKDLAEGFVICEIGHVISYKFCSPIKRNNPSTFTSLYEVGIKTKLQRRLTAYGGGDILI